MRSNSVPEQIEREALRRFPPNWAQGIDLNHSYRTGFIIGAEAALEKACKALEEVNDPESAEYIRDALEGRWD
jgi:hypothetical protein